MIIIARGHSYFILNMAALALIIIIKNQNNMNFVQKSKAFAFRLFTGTIFISRVF